ncbi:MAG: pyruvate formate lyase 1-activating protein, partial [Oscillospiraceae bacterium]|nr:pyruvate formate lyase 1-activating protein [Oscillospiraceae bacterium]
HKIITEYDNHNVLDMAKYLSEINKPVWIRHVLVPEYSDFDDDLKKLSEFIGKLKNVKKVEILPYHSLGAFKWKTLGIPYELENISPPENERIENAERILKIKE